MVIPVSARTILTVTEPDERFCGTLGQQVLRFIALPRERRRNVTMTVSTEVRLPGWSGPRNVLDAEAIRELAGEMAARGLI